MKLKSLLAVVAGAAFAVCASAADEWFVDDDNYGKVGMDGKSELSAFGTIQEAINKTKAGDTVTVLPGTYDRDPVPHATFGYSRVWIPRAITLRSRDGAAATHIVGAPDPETGTCGSNACRCICAPYANIVVKGFTLRDGYSNPDQNDKGRGGILHANQRTDVYLVDCVASNCVTRQGGLFGGVAIRCRFVRNWSNNSNGMVVGYNAWFYNCLIADNCDPGLYTIWGGRVVNCTFTGNSNGNGVAARNAGHLQLYNSIVDFGHKTYTESASSLESANNSTNTEYSLLAPALNDFRVCAGSVADGGADQQWLDVIPMPPGEDAYLDCNRQPIPKTGAFHMGCFQQTASAAGGRVESASAGFSFDGVKCCQTASYAYPTVCPTQFLVKAELKEGRRDAFRRSPPQRHRDWLFKPSR